MRTALLLALLPTLATAQTVYSWEDADGLHFSDNLASVPKNAKQVVATQLPPAPERAPLRASESPAEPTATPAPAEPARVARSASREPDEATWRRRFVETHQRLASLRQQIDSARAVVPPRLDCVGPSFLHTPAPGATAPLPPGPRCRVNPEHDRQVARIAELEAELTTTHAALQQLDREASYAAVPREWRRGF